MKRGLRGLGVFLMVGGVALLAWQLLAQAAPVAQGIRQALAVCGNLLIPSLFPFMVLAALLPATRAGLVAATPVRWLGSWLYGAPPALAPALLMSWVGGYPAGARAVAQLVDSRQLSPRQAQRALCYCVNSGPAFLVTVVGTGIFGSAQVGVILLVCQLAAGVLVARLLGRMPRRDPGAPPPPPPVFAPFSQTLVSSVTSATTAMLYICAFVLLMGGATAMLEATGTLGRLAALVEQLSSGGITAQAAGVLLAGALEICGGCSGAAALTPREALSVLPFLLSFGGISVLCQVAATVEGRRIPLGRFFFSRLLHGGLTQLLAWPILSGWCSMAPAMLPGSPALAADPRSPLGAVLLLGASALLWLTLEDPNRQNR